MTIDLHTHSTVSDGTLDPEELVLHAHAAGLTTVALTDHDTMDGIPRAAAVLPRGLTLLPGVEVSCYTVIGDRRQTLHLLAYLPDPNDRTLTAMLHATREGRRQRAREMVAALAADGHPIGWEDVLARAGGRPPGRPHIADALIAARLVATREEAFTKQWIGPGGTYHREKIQPSVFDAIAAVRGAGGVPVLAHPGDPGRGTRLTAEQLAELVGFGLDGFEIDYPTHGPEVRAWLRDLAAGLGVLGTGASDFHGSRKPQQLGDETTSPEVYEEIVARASGAALITAA
ncbi:PHP domain-containing protein [Frankia gtarii]|uniref:PHP domain-containing protein n=1 Tax=Frankia gtarii TaxID=2950102 RepID=UPI0021BE2222|nr:PHP domain-containing protein [Frankia gtarii]